MYAVDDLVILCGDLTMMEQSTDNIIGPFKKRNEKVLILPGNHETVATTDFLAELYGVETRRLNEQVRRNRDRFPEDFMF